MAGFGYLALRSGDALYSFYEWVSPARFVQYDPIITSVAAEHRLDPMLVKAVVWRESRFDNRKYGTAGERGLMQVSAKAANEWARENKVENFKLDDLFDPKTNLEAGSWYLRRAIDHWQNEAEPLPFALAEYNAGASRAQRWVGADGITTNQFLDNIDFPATRRYVQSILDRYAFYKRRSRM
jgi:soluble lytic murein transglycosylase